MHKIQGTQVEDIHLELRLIFACHVSPYQCKMV